MQRRTAGPIPDGGYRLPSFANAFGEADRERYVAERAQRIDADTATLIKEIGALSAFAGIAETHLKALAREMALRFSARYEQGAQDAFDEVARRLERLDM